MKNWNIFSRKERPSRCNHRTQYMRMNNLILIHCGHSLGSAKSPAFCLSSRTTQNTKILFFFLWDINSCLGVSGYASHSSTWKGFRGWSILRPSMPYSVLALQGWPGPAILHLIGIELRTSRLTAQCETTKPQWLMSFKSKHWYLYPRTSQKSKFSKFKNLTLPGIDPRTSWWTMQSACLNHWTTCAFDSKC